MNRISEDVTKVRMYLGPAIMYTLNVIVLFVLVVSFMLLKNASLTLYVLFPLPILSLIIYKVSSTINKKSEIVQKKQSKITSFVQEAFSGIRVLKAYNRANYFSSLYEDETENYKKASLSLALVTSLFIPAGFGHAYYSFDKENIIYYKLDNYYAPKFEKGIIFNDKDLKIKWPKKK